MGLPSFPVVLPVLNEFLIKLGMPLNIIPKKNQEFFYGITRQTMELRKTDKDQVFLALYAFNPFHPIRPYMASMLPLPIMMAIFLGYLWTVSHIFNL